MVKDELNRVLPARYTPGPGRFALLPGLTPRQSAALLSRVLFREDCSGHLAGHITVRPDERTCTAGIHAADISYFAGT